MRKYDRIETVEIFDKMWLSVSWLSGCFLTVFLIWASFEPMTSLSLTLSLFVISGLILRGLLCLSNIAIHSRHLAFQDALTSMVHANLLHYDSDKYPLGGSAIDDAIHSVEGMFSDASNDYARVGVIVDHSDRNPALRFLVGLALHVVCLTAAAALGLYFSPDVESLVSGAARWISALR